MKNDPEKYLLTFNQSMHVLGVIIKKRPPKKNSKSYSILLSFLIIA